MHEGWIIIIFATVLALGGTVISLYLRKQSLRRQRQRAAVDSVPDGPYHAVSVVYRIDACASVRRYRGRRFLPTDAPRLPLPDCSQLNCRCYYTHYGDRRLGDERRRIINERYLSTSRNHRRGVDRRRDKLLSA